MWGRPTRWLTLPKMAFCGGRVVEPVRFQPLPTARMVPIQWPRKRRKPAQRGLVQAPGPPHQPPTTTYPRSKLRPRTGLRRLLLFMLLLLMSTMVCTVSADLDLPQHQANDLRDVKTRTSGERSEGWKSAEDVIIGKKPLVNHKVIKIGGSSPAIQKSGPIKLDSAAVAALLANDPEALAKLAKISGDMSLLKASSNQTLESSPSSKVIPAKESVIKTKNADKVKNSQEMRDHKVSGESRETDKASDHDGLGEMSDEPEETPEPKPLVSFNRTISIGPYVVTNVDTRGAAELFHINSSQTSAVVVQCDAKLEELALADNSTIKTYWIDAESNAKLSDGPQLEVTANAWESVKQRAIRLRCMAQLQLADMPQPSTVFSRSLNLEPRFAARIRLTPHTLRTLPGATIRLQCEHNHSQAADLFWVRNKEPLDPRLPNLDLFVAAARSSVLYVRNVTELDMGVYECRLRRRDGAAPLTSEPSLVREVWDGLREDMTVQQPVLPAAVVAVALGAPLIHDCWTEGWSTQWFRAGQEDQAFSNETALVFDSIREADGGRYECRLRNQDGDQITHVTFIDVVSEDMNYEAEIFAVVQKNQGTPVKIMCQTFAELDETPDMVRWYRDGVQIGVPGEDRVYRRVERVAEGRVRGQALFFSVAQPADQGLYQCVVRKGAAERVQQNLLRVRQTTARRLRDLRVEVDHVRGCFSARFRLPRGTDARAARASTFFLVYHTADRARPLNIMPGHGARCDAAGACRIECWSPPYSFRPATLYSFRMSMVLDETRSVITPLSAEVNQTSWDETAARALPLQWAFQDQRLEIRWERPTTLRGQLRGFHLDLFDLTAALNATPAASESGRKFRVLLPANQTLYALNVSAPFALKLRVIARTRALLPPAFRLESARDFGYTLIALTAASTAAYDLDWRMAAPRPRIRQLDAQPALQLVFARPPRNATSVQVRYRPLTSLHHAEKAESNALDRLNGSQSGETVETEGRSTLILKDGLKLGVVYQVCAAYERRTSPRPTLGVWRCENVALVDQKGRLQQLRADDSFGTQSVQEPQRVDCAAQRYCSCGQVREDRKFVQLRWPRHAVGERADVAGYLLEHQVDEDAVEELEVVKSLKLKVTSDENDTLATVSGLFPGVRYRMRIDVLDGSMNVLTGTWFTCVAPDNLYLPPPVKIATSYLSGKNIHVSWQPPIPPSVLKNHPVLNGYFVNVLKNNEVQAKYLSQNNDILITNHGEEYDIYITSRSASREESPLRSAVIKAAAQAEPRPTAGGKAVDARSRGVWNLADKKGITFREPAPAHHAFYMSARFREWVLVVLVALLLLAVLGTAGMALYVQCGATCARCLPRKCGGGGADEDRLSLRSVASSGKLTAASSRLSLDSLPATQPAPRGLIKPAAELERLIGFSGMDESPQLSRYNHILDSKGGSTGLRSRGYRKLRRLLQDPQFAQRIADLNDDPTGQGKSFEAVLRDLAREQRDEHCCQRALGRRASRHSAAPHSPGGSLCTQPSTNASTTVSMPFFARPDDDFHAHHDFGGGQPPQTRSLPTHSAKNLLLHEPAAPSLFTHRHAHSNINVGGAEVRVQAEVHAEAAAATSRRPLAKANSLAQLGAPAAAAAVAPELSTSDGNVAHIHASQLFKRPLRPGDSDDPLAAAAAAVAPHVSAFAAKRDAAAALNPVERRRVMTTDLASVAPADPAPPPHTSSMPNLADSGIVYDECGHHVGTALPLHAINSEKVLRRYEPIVSDDYDSLLPDHTSAVSSSSGASSESAHADQRALILSPLDAFAVFSHDFCAAADKANAENGIELRDLHLETV